MVSKALGKGLSALIPEKSADIDKGDITYIDSGIIENNSLQPRTNYDDTKLEELKASIEEKGILQPILVRPKGEGYEVVAGERRLRVARQLELKEVPAMIKDVSDQEALVIALVENIQREELNPIEEAEAFKKLIDEFNYTQEVVAQAVGKDRSTVSNLLRILKLPDDIKKSVYDGELSVGHARALLGVDSFIERTRIYKKVLKEGLSVREVENLINQQTEPSKKREKIAKAKDPQVAALEENLQKLLGTKVTVVPKKKRGKIVIEYYSLNDLDRIIKAFIK